MSLDNASCRLVITGVGTYDITTTNTLIKVIHNEQPYTQTARIVIDNFDKALTGSTWQGKAATLGWRYNGSYVDAAPFKVKGQGLQSIEGRLICELELYGIPDQLQDDHASTNYTQTSSDSNTVQTLINAIAGAALAPYTHTTSFTVTYDSTDSLITTFKPADYFSVSVGANRLDKIKQLLSFTNCVMRVQSDGAIHIFNPTVSGGVYDYSFNDAVDGTTFFTKEYRNRLVIPNKIIVQSHPDHSPIYSGSATDSNSFGLLPKTNFMMLRLTSDSQATAIATAMIQRLQVDARRGQGSAPIQQGLQVYDYISMVDSREGDTVVGNIGYITRSLDLTNNAKPFTHEFGFGNIMLGGSIGILDASGAGAVATLSTAQQIAMYNQIIDNLKSLNDAHNQLRTEFDELREQGVFQKGHFIQQLIIPVI